MTATDAELYRNGGALFLKAAGGGDGSPDGAEFRAKKITGLAVALAFAAGIAIVHLGLVWVSTGFYFSAARAPLDERLGLLLARSLMWAAAFLAFSWVMIRLKRKRRAR